jgi:hypothetical protein
MLAAPCLVLVALALLARALQARRGPVAGRPTAWPFFAAPPAIFTVQEHLERVGQVIVDERVFWAGLALQALLGLVAWLVARVLLGVATVVGRRLRPRVSSRPPSARPVLAQVLARRLSLLAAGHAQRGPPAFLVG